MRKKKKKGKGTEAKPRQKNQKNQRIKQKKKQKREKRKHIKERKTKGAANPIPAAAPPFRLFFFGFSSPVSISSPVRHFSLLNLNP
jgi:hypothetical protein